MKTRAIDILRKRIETDPVLRKAYEEALEEEQLIRDAGKEKRYVHRKKSDEKRIRDVLWLHLKDIMMASGLSIGSVAKSAGVSKGLLSDLLMNNSQCSVGLLVRFLSVCGYEVDVSVRKKEANEEQVL